MTNDELKKKIISALQSVEFVTEKGWCGQCISLRLDYSAIADALIAAGIGDVKEHRIFAGKDGSIKQLYSGEEVEQIVKEREEYKHRAEVAERALFLSAKEIEYLNGDFDSSAEFFAKEKVIPYFMKKAEKELAEEGKDD